MAAVQRMSAILRQSGRILTFARSLSTSTVSLKKFEHDFILDPRRGQRELVENYSSKGKDFRIELADPEDEAILTEFISQLFAHQVSMITSIGMTHAETREFIQPEVAEALQVKLTPMIFHEDRLVGAYTFRFFDEEALAKKMPFSEDLRKSGKAKFVIKPDYAEDIKNGPYSYKANCLVAFLNEFYLQAGNMLPLNCRRLAFGDTSAVHPLYNGNKFLHKLCDIPERLSRDKYKADYIASIAVTAASNHVAKTRALASEWTTVATFPFDAFKADGKIVFANREDKVEDAIFGLVKLRKD